MPTERQSRRHARTQGRRQRDRDQLGERHSSRRGPAEGGDDHQDRSAQGRSGRPPRQGLDQRLGHMGRRRDARCATGDGFDRPSPPRDPSDDGATDQREQPGICADTARRRAQHSTGGRIQRRHGQFRVVGGRQRGHREPGGSLLPRVREPNPALVGDVRETALNDGGPDRGSTSVLGPRKRRVEGDEGGLHHQAGAQRIAECRRRHHRCDASGVPLDPGARG